MGEFSSPINVENSWAYGNGFMLGGGSPAVPAVAHVVITSTAWHNAGNGFIENGNPGRLVLTRDTAFRNSRSGFYFSLSSATLTGNLNRRNARSADLPA